MPALVDSMAYNHMRGMPWHREGNGFAPGEVTSWEQMRQQSGLTWEVRTGDVEYTDPATGARVTIPDYQRVYRDDTNAVLNVAKGGYTPHTHEELGELIESLHAIGSKQGIDWDTAGSLDGGKKVFVAAKLGDDWEVPGDPSPTRSFLTILTSHDGTGATKGGLCNTRVVCANTFRAAEVEMKNGRAFWFRHSRSLGKERIEEAEAAIRYGMKEVEHARTRAEYLARVPFTDEQIYEWIDRCYPLPKAKGDTPTKKHEADVRSTEKRRKELGYICMEANPNLAGIRNTAWGVFNAATEYLDHYKQWKSQDRYIESSLLSDNKEKRFALAAAISIAESGDARKIKVAVPR